MVVHLWGKFWMAAWRGRRALTWITGVVCFLASIGTAFTGYLIQTNLDSQWISTQAKDGLNSVASAPGSTSSTSARCCSSTSSLLPLVLGVLVVWHILLVRARGVVPPLDATEDARSRPCRDRPSRPARVRSASRPTELRRASRWTGAVPASTTWSRSS